MINQGFTETQKHSDQRLDTMDVRLGKVEQIQKDMLDELSATHEDVRYLRRSMDMLVRNDAAQDAAIKTLALTAPKAATLSWRLFCSFAPAQPPRSPQLRHRSMNTIHDFDNNDSLDCSEAAVYITYQTVD
jgi:hypothetical protein